MAKKPHWTPEEYLLACRLQHEGLTYKEIAVHVNRGPGAVKSKLSYEKAGRTEMDRNVVSLARPTPEVLNDRTNRLFASQRMSTTALLMGDPPPGYSARDRRAQ